MTLRRGSKKSQGKGLYEGVPRTMHKGKREVKKDTDGEPEQEVRGKTRSADSLDSKKTNKKGI